MKKYLFIDDTNVEVGSAWRFSKEAEITRSPYVDGKGMIYGDDLYGPCARVRRVMHQPKRYPKFPLLESDQPWEGNNCYFGGRYLDKDPESGKYRMYYQVWTLELDPETEKREKSSANPTAAVPGVNTIEHAKVCMAISNDGINWEKPNLGVVDYKGSKDNNIVLDPGMCGAIWGGYIRDEQETDPAKRFKSISFGSVGDWHGFNVYFSPDGISWTPYGKNPVLSARIDCGDTGGLFGRHPKTGKYIFYLRPQDWWFHYPDKPFYRVMEGKWPFGADMRNHGYRTVGYSESDNFIDWTIPQTVIAPDLEDSFATQFYGMTVGDYADYFMGLIWVWNTDSAVDNMTIQLASSRDGKNWKRIGNRKPFLAPGEEGPWESKMILAPAAPFFVVDDEIRIYYAAFNCTHYGSRWDERKGAIGMATLRLDGFVGIQSDAEEEGYFISRPIELDGSDLEMEINADASGGYCRVEVLDLDCNPIRGFSHRDCVPLTEDRIRHTVRWNERSSLGSAGKQEVYFRFRLKNAEIFSFTLKEMAR